MVWAAVPCGTASRAREIPLANGGKGPRQLRSKEFPRGLRGLTPVESQRVEKANQIYDNVAILLELSLQQGLFFAIENPRGSYLWDYPWYKELISRPGVYDSDFQHCKWSPGQQSRPKWARLRTNVPELRTLSGPCSLDHIHLGWGRDSSGNFYTAGEAEYPYGMVAAIAGCFGVSI